jgi:hypothetical protein
MNTTLTSERSLDRDVQLELTNSPRLSRLSTLDRLSLRLGVWLLLRSTRRLDEPRDRETHERARAAQRARLARDATSYEHLARAHRA